MPPSLVPVPQPLFGVVERVAEQRRGRAVVRRPQQGWPPRRGGSERSVGAAVGSAVGGLASAVAVDGGGGRRCGGGRRRSRDSRRVAGAGVVMPRLGADVAATSAGLTETQPTSSAPGPPGLPVAGSQRTPPVRELGRMLTVPLAPAAAEINSGRRSASPRTCRGSCPRYRRGRSGSADRHTSRRSACRRADPEHTGSCRPCWSPIV